MTKRRYIISIALALGACATPVQPLPNSLTAVPSDTLCESYSYYAKAVGTTGAQTIAVRVEIDRRELISASHWETVVDGRFRVGFSECALFAAWGKPGQYGSVNRTVTAGGARTQWVYRSSRTASAQYVYTEGGRVTAFQD